MKDDLMNLLAAGDEFYSLFGRGKTVSQEHVNWLLGNWRKYRGKFENHSGGLPGKKMPRKNKRPEIILYEKVSCVS